MTEIMIFKSVLLQIRIMITAIDKQGLRKKLIDACVAKQQFLIDDFKGRIKTLTESQGPLYRAMEGRQKGDTFTFKGTEYKIKDVF